MEAIQIGSIFESNWFGRVIQHRVEDRNGSFVNVRILNGPFSQSRVLRVQRRKILNRNGRICIVEQIAKGKDNYAFYVPNPVSIEEREREFEESERAFYESLGELEFYQQNLRQNFRN